MRLRIATTAGLLIGLLAVSIVQAEHNGTPAERNVFPDIKPTIREGIKKVLNTTVGDMAHVFAGNDEEIIDWKEVHVPGKAIKECLGPDKTLNEEVLRCRNGYTQRVPIYKK